ncbi:MAG: hypothetical protein V4594_24240 [Bacteroidota bacterium]
MKKISDLVFADFLANKPLYYKIKAVEDLKEFDNTAFVDPFGFKDKPFKFSCPEENNEQTFKTDLIESGYPRITQLIRSNSDELPYSFDPQTKRLDLKIHVQGVCQSCKAKIDFLIKTSSDKEWDKRKEGMTITIQKIGQFPSYDVGLNTILKKYLNEEDQSNYKKALICLSISYGIGAYAYLRRVIENEIKRIIQDIAELEFDGVEYVQTAYEAFKTDFQMSKLIEVVNKYLPGSLKDLGDNPVRLLYEQLSGGIHEFTDEQCIEKAHHIDVLLNYVIRKINEEKYQLSDVKKAMIGLRQNK